MVVHPWRSANPPRFARIVGGAAIPTSSGTGWTEVRFALARGAGSGPLPRRAARVRGMNATAVPKTPSPSPLPRVERVRSRDPSDNETAPALDRAPPHGRSAADRGGFPRTERPPITMISSSSLTSDTIGNRPRHRRTAACPGAPAPDGSLPRARTVANKTWTLGFARRRGLASLGAGDWLRSAQAGIGFARRGRESLRTSSVGRSRPRNDGPATGFGFGRRAGVPFADRVDISGLRAVARGAPRRLGDRNWLRSAPEIGFGRPKRPASTRVGGQSPTKTPPSNDSSPEGSSTVPGASTGQAGPIAPEAGDGRPHPGVVDLVDVDRVADASEHGQGEPAAEVLAELLQALEQGRRGRGGSGGRGRSRGRRGSGGRGRRPPAAGRGRARNRPCRSPRRWRRPRRGGGGSRSSARACGPTSGRSRAAGPRGPRTGRRPG